MPPPAGAGGQPRGLSSQRAEKRSDRFSKGGKPTRNRQHESPVGAYRDAASVCQQLSPSHCDPSLVSGHLAAVALCPRRRCSGRNGTVERKPASVSSWSHSPGPGGEGVFPKTRALGPRLWQVISVLPSPPSRTTGRHSIVIASSRRDPLGRCPDLSTQTFRLEFTTRLLTCHTPPAGSS